MTTNIRTFVQFSQYGDVIQLTVNANKLQAMNIVKFGYGVKSLSVLREYTENTFLPTGQVTRIN